MWMATIRNFDYCKSVCFIWFCFLLIYSLNVARQMKFDDFLWLIDYYRIDSPSKTMDSMLPFWSKWSKFITHFIDWAVILVFYALFDYINYFSYCKLVRFVFTWVELKNFLNRYKWHLHILKDNKININGSLDFWQ